MAARKVAVWAENLAATMVVPWVAQTAVTSVVSRVEPRVV